MSYRVIHRGPTRPVPKEFCCPVHGDFTADADRDAEFAPCPYVEWEVSAGGEIEEPCVHGIESPWSPRKVPAIRMRRVEAVRGKDEKPEHKGWLDSTNIEQGQDPDDFAADREKVHEELRKDLVMDLVRSDR